MGGAYGLRKLGVENIKPIITRGILVDVAATGDRATSPTVTRSPGTMRREPSENRGLTPTRSGKEMRFSFAMDGPSCGGSRRSTTRTRPESVWK